MASEVEYQRRIITSINRQGGYGKKWSSQFQVGVPDLVLSHPKTGVVFMEVKLLKDVGKTASKAFDRKIGITAKQTEELKLLHAAGAQACIGVIVAYSPRNVLLVVLPHGAQRLDSRNIDAEYPCTKWEPVAGFRMVPLLHLAGFGDVNDRT